jgi:hypothetical protein
MAATDAWCSYARELLVGHPRLPFRASLDADDALFAVELLDSIPTAPRPFGRRLPGGEPPRVAHGADTVTVGEAVAARARLRSVAPQDPSPKQEHES